MTTAGWAVGPPLARILENGVDTPPRGHDHGGSLVCKCPPLPAHLCTDHLGQVEERIPAFQTFHQPRPPHCLSISHVNSQQRQMRMNVRRCQRGYSRRLNPQSKTSPLRIQMWTQTSTSRFQHEGERRTPAPQTHRARMQTVQTCHVRRVRFPFFTLYYVNFFSGQTLETPRIVLMISSLVYMFEYRVLVYCCP